MVTYTASRKSTILGASRNFNAAVIGFYVFAMKLFFKNFPM